MLYGCPWRRPGPNIYLQSMFPESRRTAEGTRLRTASLVLESRSKIALLSVRVACTAGQPQRQLYAAARCGARTVPTQRQSAATANEALDTAPNHPER